MTLLIKFLRVTNLSLNVYNVSLYKAYQMRCAVRALECLATSVSLLECLVQQSHSLLVNKSNNIWNPSRTASS